MKNLEGVCMMCRMPLLVATVDITGRKRPLCPDCEKKAERIAKIVLEKSGKKTNKKTFIYPKAE